MKLLNYRTVEEKAIEWNISSRHIQYLCRMGKIEGVIKRGGVWFISNDAPIPTKNTKSGTKDFKFVGTRKKIFDSAIELFMSKGYNEVSLRDIADSVDIRQSTVYNHFNSKQEILDTIYDFYCCFYLKDRKSIEEIIPMFEDKSRIDIIMATRYEFNADYQQKMSDITRIIFQRINIDEKARKIAKSLLVDEGITYVEDVFKKGIENGRFAPFDTHVIAVFINSIAIFSLYNWIIDPSPENMKKTIEDEKNLYKHAAGFITDLKPPLNPF